MCSMINLSFINHPLQLKNKRTSDPSSLMKIYIGLLGNIIHEWHYQLILFHPCESINEEIERHRFQFLMKSFMVRSKIRKTSKGESWIQHHYNKTHKGCQLNFICVASFLTLDCDLGWICIVCRRRSWDRSCDSCPWFVLHAIDNMTYPADL